MKKKKLIATLIVGVMLATTACSSSDVADLNNMEALNTESNVSSIKLATSYEEAAVYSQVSDRTLLDLTTLEEVNATDEQAVIAYMDSVDAQLCGSVSANSGVIDECYTNYLLMEFEKTPYHWQRAEMNIRGMDSSSRSIVVDMTYKTTGYSKDAQLDSFITQGEPNYEQKLEVRYSRWLTLLSAKYGYSGSNWQEDYETFVDVYGEPNDIIESQRNDSLTTQVYTTGQQLTYSGLIDTEQEQTSATMVVRYVIAPNYVLGINQGFACQHMYLLNYSLDNDFTVGRELYNEEGSSKIADSVFDLIYSYYQCEDENNYSGLYSLVNNFERLDKYYSDYFDTTYRKHDNFTVSLFNVSGTTIECGVSVSVKVRAKGSNMTMPIYTQRWYYTIELIEDELKVTNAVLLSSTIEGEPVITTDEVETSGFTSKITLTNTDKQSLENLIATFGTLQLLGDTTSDSFSDIVDTSIADSQMSELKDNMNTVTAVKRVTWLTSYLQGTSNYASVRCKELFQQEDGTIYEASVTYDFINKGNQWYIYRYNVDSIAKLDTQDLTTKNSLCIVSPGNVDSYTSQVVTTSSDVTATDTGIIGTVTTYEFYEPAEKSEETVTDGTETSTGGYNSSNVSANVIQEVYDGVGASGDYTANDYSTMEGALPTELKTLWLNAIADYQNRAEGYISDIEYADNLFAYRSEFDAYVIPEDGATDISAEYIETAKTMFANMITYMQ